MDRREFLEGLTVLGVTASLTFGPVTPAWAAPEKGKKSDPPGGPYNMILIIQDHLSYRLLTPDDYRLPATEVLKRRGTNFEHHYIASAMCTPSRASCFRASRLRSTACSIRWS